MQIDDYFSEIQKIIKSCNAVGTFDVYYDKRGTHEGFIRGEIYLLDGSILHFREFIDVETLINRLLYVYHYVDSSKKLIFRYDNTGHHKKLNLATFPHHKHEGSENKIISSTAPTLRGVLNEILTSISIF
ncbi:hypothetical protein H8E88_27785 [candidate division KSB1 bacterium]|nr:hypothetical protein [candidate division KSB1 bacterium]MBL7095549.1 hypothetical protein [candidate division KSB1 bacterium]